MVNIPDSVWSLVANRVDWSRPELAAHALQRKAGDLPSAVRGLIRHLRARETPKPGYSAAYYRLLRDSANASQKAAAAAAWDAAVHRELTMPYHTNTYSAIGPENIALAATSERCDAMATRILAQRADWPKNRWGFGETAGVALLLTYLWPVAECSDDALVPIFAWLLEQSDAEWIFMSQLQENVLGTSGHNWYAHSFKGFFVAGVMWPEFAGLGRFRALGGDYLAREVAVLFEDDGWSKEGSAGYHEFALSSLLHLAHVAEINGIGIPAIVRERLRKSADAGWRMIAPDGCFPLFGDDGRANAAQTLRSRAAQFNLPHAKFVAEAITPAWRPSIGHLLPVEGRDAMADFLAVKSEKPLTLDTHLPRSGLYAMRTAWAPNADFLAVMAGPLGSIISSHKHADLFTIEVFSRGRRILVDNGYGAEVPELKDSKQFRLWRIGTSAHNTVTVDGQSQLPIPQEFRFRGTVSPLVEDWRTEDQFAYFSGVHESYRHLAEEVSAVRRKIFFVRGKYWIIIDRFTPATAAEHEYVLHFQLNAPCTLGADGRAVTSGQGGNLMIFSVPGASGQAKLEPCPYPIESTKKEPAHAAHLPEYDNPAHLSYTRRASGGDLFVTLLVPFDGEKTPAFTARLMDIESDGRMLTRHEATALEITFEGERHVYVDHHMHWNLPWRCGGFSGERRLFHSTCMP